MTLKTLNVIHQVLSKEAESRRQLYKLARKAADCADDYDPELQAAADTRWKEWSEVSDALHAFEDREW